MLMYTLITGLLIPKDEQKRPQRDENSPKIPLDFLCLTAAFLRNSWVAQYEMPQQLVEFFFARGKHIFSQKWAIPENIRTIPRTAFRNSEGKGGFLELEIRRHGGYLRVEF